MPDPITDTSGIVEGDGHFLHNHPDIMANPAAKNSLAKYESADKAMLGGVDAMALIGRPHINIPADDADDAAKTKFKVEIAKHLGAVEKVEDFKITRPEGADETNYNFAAEKAFLEMAVIEKFNQEQLTAAYKMHAQIVNGILTKQDADNKATQDKAIATLTNDCGGEAGYKTFTELNTRCLEAFFDADTAKMIEDTGLGNNVGFAKGINALAQMAVKEGRTMKASATTQQKIGGALQYKKMEARAKENG